MTTNKVLICDDEEGVRESLKLILSDHYDLILTESGEQALDCLKHAKDIGLVLVDLKIPRMDGYEIMSRMKEIAPDMNVVVITGYGSVDAAAAVSKLGACDYIVKPFESKDILETVKTNLDYQC